MTALVIAEVNQNGLSPHTARVVKASLSLAEAVHVLVVGAEGAAQEAARLQGVANVIHVPENGAVLAESVAPRIAELARGYTHVLAPASTFGKDVLPRVAPLLDVSQVSDVLKIHAPDTFTRPIYAGNALETVQSMDAIKLLTIRTTAFEVVGKNNTPCPITRMDPLASQALSQFIAADVARSERPELSAARVVVSGGRALGSAEQFTLIEQLADALGGAVGASRAAVDAGFVPNDYQVGQTGKVVAPELYIAVGISGAIQHIAGMRESRVIVAINKDENAAIFDVADFGLVADLFVAVPELISGIKG